jgi:hypothetical protein
MPRTTNIEQLMDLSEIFDKQPQKQSQMQSMDGYPRPPHMNSNYDEQMLKENDERDRQRNSFQGKIRQSSDMRRAMNAGMPDDDYPMIQSRVNQRGDIVPYYDKPSMSNMSNMSNMEDDDIDYDMGPKTRFNHFNTGMSNSSNISCMDIARHVKSCPICSKLYENDKSIYIIGIVFLLVVCIILLKKVIENVK